MKTSKANEELELNTLSRLGVAGLSLWNDAPNGAEKTSDRRRGCETLVGHMLSEVMHSHRCQFYHRLYICEIHTVSQGCDMTCRPKKRYSKAAY